MNIYLMMIFYFLGDLSLNVNKFEQFHDSNNTSNDFSKTKIIMS